MTEQKSGPAKKPASAPKEAPAPEAPKSRQRRRRPEWMVPTDDGMVPEREVRQRDRAEVRKKAEAARRKRSS